MSDSYLDALPSREREKIRGKLRSPEAYAALRERVKGPEDLEREMERGERMAELHLAMESEPRAREHVRAMLEKDIAEQGVDAALDVTRLPEQVRVALLRGRFSVAVEEHPQTHQDTLVVIPEGAVQEKVPVKSVLSERYASTLTQSSPRLTS